MEEVNPALKAFSDQVRIRVCGILLQQDKVLVMQHGHTIGNSAFWAPPGGGVQFGETLQQCLQREFLEETGLQVQVGRFLYLNEFIRKPLHALELFFEVTALGGTPAAGHDPELDQDRQLIRSLHYLTLQELNSIPPADKHTIFHDLMSLDDLLLPQNHFL